MTAFIIYTDGKHNISELCVNVMDIRSNILIPCIGETFIDKKRDIEYEVKDIIRTYNSSNEYGVQVMLKRREERKYK